MDEAAFRRLISGRTQDFRSRLLRTGLRGLSLFYAAGMAVRNAAYDVVPGLIHNCDVPVISIGNLTTGGTGKTPVVAMVVERLLAAGIRPGIVSRGYRADASGSNDEHRVLARQFPDVPHEQNRSRVTAAGQVLSAGGVDGIVMDDGFQHRRLGRDLNIVLVDATNPFGFGYQLPRGLLRESPRSLRRADLVLLTRSDLVSEETCRSISAEIVRRGPHLSDSVFPTRFEATCLIRPDGMPAPPDELAGRSVYLMSGIGNPEAFRTTCESLHTIVVGERVFADHHHYTESEVSEVLAEADRHSADGILTTEKDLVKLQSCYNRIWTVGIGCRFLHDDDSRAFDRFLGNTFPDVQQDAQTGSSDT